MTCLFRLVVLFVSLFLGAEASAQQKVLLPEKLERPTVTDDKGVVQWAPWKGVKCQGCSGSGKVKCDVCDRFGDDATNCPDCKRSKERLAVCRICAGTGELADPLDKVACPGCQGAAFQLCSVCGGGGRLKIGGAKQWSDCPSCRGDGAFKCGTCNGSRLVEPAALKPSLREASVKDLAKAITVVDAALTEVGAIEPAGGDKARKSVKALVKACDTAGGTFPPLKRLGKPFEDFMGKIYAGKQFQGSAENEANTIANAKKSAEYYLKHQKRMLDLAHKRAEANAKLAGEQKGK
ncbi:MAG: hypothetical protein JNK15_18865 [Planctomycetes bacterium]|nr:hypothetical protein [Planctomycetota bacterium]